MLVRAAETVAALVVTAALVVAMSSRIGSLPASALFTLHVVCFPTILRSMLLGLGSFQDRERSSCVGRQWRLLAPFSPPQHSSAPGVEVSAFSGRSLAVGLVVFM